MILTRFNGILFHGILMGFNGTQWGWMGYNGIHNKHQPTIWWVYPPIVMSKTGMIMSTSGLRGVTDPWADLPGAHLYCISSHDQRSKTSYLVYRSPLKFAPRRWELHSVGCPAYPPTKWYGDTYKMVAPMGVAAYKMVAPGYPTCPPTSSILG